MKARILQGGGRVRVEYGWTDREEHERAERLGLELHRSGFEGGEAKHSKSKKTTSCIYTCGLGPRTWPRRCRKHREDPLYWWLVWMEHYGVGVSIEMIKGANRLQRMKWKVTIEGHTEASAKLWPAADLAYKAWLKSGRPIDGITTAQIVSQA